MFGGNCGCGVVKFLFGVMLDLIDWNCEIFNEVDGEKDHWGGLLGVGASLVVGFLV